MTCEASCVHRTIAGQADIWWAARPTLAHGRPHALLFSRCQNVVVSNLTVKDSPFWCASLSRVWLPLSLGTI